MTNTKLPLPGNAWLPHQPQAVAPALWQPHPSEPTPHLTHSPWSHLADVTHVLAAWLLTSARQGQREGSQLPVGSVTSLRKKLASNQIQEYLGPITSSLISTWESKPPDNKAVFIKQHYKDPYPYPSLTLWLTQIFCSFCHLFPKWFSAKLISVWPFYTKAFFLVHYIITTAQLLLLFSYFWTVQSLLNTSSRVSKSILPPFWYLDVLYPDLYEKLKFLHFVVQAFNISVIS